MKITGVKLLVLEQPKGYSGRSGVEQVPNPHRIEYSGGGSSGSGKGRPRQHFIQVDTDEGISSRCTTDMPVAYIERCSFR